MLERLYFCKTDGTKGSTSRPGKPASADLPMRIASSVGMPGSSERSGAVGSVYADGSAGLGQPLDEAARIDIGAEFEADKEPGEDAAGEPITVDAIERGHAGELAEQVFF